ncbi:MAG: hypothetical protein H0T42_00055 [Deltaproteobacteria bacterium]|nr:hypothetical protein [Deltaproteobacteria bacterium]
MADARHHRFRPRYRGLALGAMGLGGGLVAVGAAIGLVAAPLVTGAIGIVFGGAYLASPTWRLEVITDDEGLEVRSPKRSRFRLAWADVVRVVASPTTNTCFVDGGAPERSLLVPGVGAPAPYDLEDRPALVSTILARVHPDRITIVASLDLATVTPTQST